MSEDPQRDQAHAAFRDLRRRFMPPEMADSFMPLDKGEVQRYLDEHPDAGPHEVRAWLAAKVKKYASEQEAAAALDPDREEP